MSSDAKYSGIVGENDSYEFDFTRDLARVRYSNYEYALGEFVTVGAFVYECTNVGKTAEDAPEFDTTIGGTVTDGSVVWTCRDFSASGTDTISSLSVPSVTGVTVDSSAIEKSTRVVIAFTLDAEGVFVLVCEIVTTSGKTLKQRLHITVA